MFQHDQMSNLFWTCIRYGRKDRNNLQNKYMKVSTSIDQKKTTQAGRNQKEQAASKLNLDQRHQIIQPMTSYSVSILIRSIVSTRNL